MQSEIKIASLIFDKVREKLEAYFKATKGEYPGGPTYNFLMSEIESWQKRNADTMCMVCHEVPVDVNNGLYTCDSCVARV